MGDSYGPDAVVESIRKHRQAFAYGVFSAHSMIDYGIEAGATMEPLATNITSELVHADWYFPRRLKMNYQLYEATANRLAMQFIVSVADSCESNLSGWKDSNVSEMQFLRMIRNAAAHNNELRFDGGDPRDGTVWRGFEITEDMEGRQVFPDVSEMIVGTETVDVEEGFFEAGDALSLVTDILGIVVRWSDSYTFDDIRDVDESR